MRLRITIPFQLDAAPTPLFLAHLFGEVRLRDRSRRIDAWGFLDMLKAEETGRLSPRRLVSLPFGPDLGVFLSWVETSRVHVLPGFSIIKAFLGNCNLKIGTSPIRSKMAVHVVPRFRGVRVRVLTAMSRRALIRYSHCSSLSPRQCAQCDLWPVAGCVAGTRSTRSVRILRAEARRE